LDLSPQFLWDTIKSVRQVQRSDGFLGGRLLVNPRYVFWTMTVWLDEPAMNAYRTSGAHRQAMPKLLNWCDEAAVVHWTQESPAIPSWQQAQQHMSEKGKLSKVNHPSAAQAAQQIPAPQPSRVAQTLKPARQIRT
jgi:heme-degrading monooxygenase HmoA